MDGRLEHKIETESTIKEKIKNCPQFVQRYYLYLNLKTHNTKYRYIINVLRFLEHISNGNINSLTIKDIENITQFEIEQYMSEINYYYKNGEIKELKNSSKAIIYSSINSFFVFMSNNKLIKINPFDNKCIQRPKIQEGEITFLTPEEVKLVEEKILSGAGNNRAKGKQRDWKLRDLLLFRIPVVTGLRVSALSEINIKDIDFKNNTISVIEKGNINKKIYIDDKTRSYILEWMLQRRKLLDDKLFCDALFISNRKERITTRAINDIIQKYTSEVTKKHITPHKLRSTCGTNLYQSEKDIYLVAEVLGHKSTAPTKRYTKIFEDNKRNAINVIANLYD